MVVGADFDPWSKPVRLDRIVDRAFQRAPKQSRGLIEFTTLAGLTTKADALAVAPSSDEFKAGTEVGEKDRIVTVMPKKLDFAPAAGMFATWAGIKWNVTGVTALQPGGEGSPILVYRVALSR